MKSIKLLTNDFVLFLVNMVILTFIYFNFIYQCFDVNLLVEIFSIAISYYFISLFTTLVVLTFLYNYVRSAFNINFKYSMFKKLEIVSSVFDKYYDDINSLDDLELKLKDYL